MKTGPITAIGCVFVLSIDSLLGVTYFCGLTSRSIFCIGGSLNIIMKLYIYICIYISICLLSGFSHVWFFVTPWTVVHKAPLSMEFSRQEHWSGLPFPSPAHWHVPPQIPLSPELQWWTHHLPWSQGGLLLSTGKVHSPFPRMWRAALALIWLPLSLQRKHLWGQLESCP